MHLLRITEFRLELFIHYHLAHSAVPERITIVIKIATLTRQAASFSFRV